MQQHPELSLSIELSDRSVDLIEEGYDLAIRTNPTSTPGLVAWPLMPLRYVLCAAPVYLARHGTPATPMELNRHHCITGTDIITSSWQFRGPDGPMEVPIFGRLQINNALLRSDAARSGAGILLCAEYLVEEDLGSGRLVPLLTDYSPATSTLHAVSPAYRAGSPKVRSLVNHLSTQLSEQV